MSTLSSTLNSLASSTVMDLYMPLFGRDDLTEVEQLRLSRWVTFFWGIVLISIAVLARHWGPVLEAGLTIASVPLGALLGVFALGFMVFRSLLKLYIERRVNRLGSKIKTKLVVGALGLSILPVVCLVAFSFYFLNRTLDKWFSWPTTQILDNSLEVARELNDVMRQKAETDARWIGSIPDVAAVLDGRGPSAGFQAAIQPLIDRGEFQYVALLRAGDDRAFVEFGEEEYLEIDRYCKEKGIEWFASCWDEDSVDFIANFNPPCFKIASASLTDDALLKHHRKYNKPIILSTGAANLKEVSHEISAATKPCSTAPGNKSGIVHAQSSFITKNAMATIPINKAINPGIIASFFVFLSIFILLLILIIYFCTSLLEILNYQHWNSYYGCNY